MRSRQISARVSSPIGLLLIVLTFTATPAAAQYFDQSVLQKDFESADFFFRSSYLNPYGLDGFGPGAAGIISQRLLDLHLSPSLVPADSARRTYIYMDFRSDRDRTSGDEFYIAYGAAESLDQSIYPPYRYQNTYQEAEPLLALALFTRPVASLPKLTAGVTYRLIANDQSYYDVPTGQYRGLDLAAEAAASSGVVVDVYSGSDQMRTTGHFTSLFAAYEVSPSWRLGVRADLTAFNRDGEIGNTFNPVSFGRSNDVQISSQFDARSQSYNHVDLSVGVDGALSADTRVGGSLGLLTGTADQLQEGDSRYQYTSGSLLPGEDGNHYTAGSLRFTELTREGRSAYSTLFVRRALGRGRTLTASWRGDWQSLDLAGESSLADSSISRSQNFGTTSTNLSAYDYFRHDERSGTGSLDGQSHRISLGLEWKLSDKSTLVFGAVARHRTETTSTQESVALDYETHRYSEWNDGDNENRYLYDESLVEDKDMEWTLDSRRASVQIPILLTHALSEHFEFEVGFTQRMEDIRLKDVVLADIHARESVLNGTTSNDSNLRERYRQPTVYRSSVTTSALLAVTARPSPDFDIRLSVSPRNSTGYFAQRTTQWWLGFQFRP